MPKMNERHYSRFRSETVCLWLVNRTVKTLCYLQYIAKLRFDISDYLCKLNLFQGGKGKFLGSFAFSAHLAAGLW